MSDSPAFWDHRYREKKTPWDYGGVPPEFLDWLERRARPGKVLLPGCGQGHELAALAKVGAEPVGLDVSPEAIQLAKASLGNQPGQLLVGDFFTHPLAPGQFDTVYERTFLCALEPDLWPRYGQKMAEILKPGGLLVGYFLFGEEPEPPPHPLQEGEDLKILNPYFELLESRAAHHKLTVFADFEERWQIWRKRSVVRQNF